MNNEVTETLTAQIELDKTAEEFRNAHEERDVLIQQWEKIIDQMKRRDQEMDKCAGVNWASMIVGAGPFLFIYGCVSICRNWQV